MEKLHYRDNSAFSLIEMMAVLFIIGILIIILSMVTISNYSKYKDRMALNEVISDIYLVQTDSLKSNNSYIDFFTRDNEYIVYSNGKKVWKKIPRGGRTLLNGNTIRLKYRHGNLVSKANTIDVKLSSCKYKVIVHLDSGYITVDEV